MYIGATFHWFWNSVHVCVHSNLHCTMTVSFTFQVSFRPCPHCLSTNALSLITYCLKLAIFIREECWISESTIYFYYFISSGYPYLSRILCFETVFFHLLTCTSEKTSRKWALWQIDSCFAVKWNAGSCLRAYFPKLSQMCRQVDKQF